MPVSKQIQEFADIYAFVLHAFGAGATASASASAGGPAP
jgi:hypothetical protein